MVKTTLKMMIKTNDYAMLFTGLRRGEMLYLDVDRDVNFEEKTITVRGAVSFSNGNQPEVYIVQNYLNSVIWDEFIHLFP